MPLPDIKDLLTILGYFMVFICWFAIIFLLIFVFAGCAVTQVEGMCYYKRELITTYYCEQDGKMDQYRFQPPD